MWVSSTLQKQVFVICSAKDFLEQGQQTTSYGKSAKFSILCGCGHFCLCVNKTRYRHTFYVLSYFAAHCLLLA